ncbi:MAG: hypothetical protein ACJ71K_18410 [Nitrososphaeraceae archaeon]
MEEEEKEKKQMKKIYDDTLFSTDLLNKKKGVKALASYGKKAIPFIQELRSVETNEGMKNYMFDAITQINKASRKKERTDKS